MHHSKFQNILLLLGISGLIFSGSYAQTATVTNASFNTFIAATDSFPGWSFKKDSLGGTRYTITQETDSAHSTPGALKMLLKSSTDTSFTAGVTGTITGLPPKKIFTLTAWVKYVNTPDAYRNAQFAVSQATTLSAAPWYIFRRWSTLWENSTVSSNGWTQITFSDTTADSANYITIVITLWKSGTLWVDDIAVTYHDIAPQSVNYAVTPGKQGSIRNNRILFSREMPYSIEASSIDGKRVFCQSGLASALDLDRLDLKNGVYLMRVRTPGKTYNSKVIVSR